MQANSGERKEEENGRREESQSEGDHWLPLDIKSKCVLNPWISKGVIITVSGPFFPKKMKRGEFVFYLQMLDQTISLPHS